MGEEDIILLFLKSIPFLKRVVVPTIYKVGELCLVISICALAFNYWGVFHLEMIPIPHIVDFVYLWVMINGLAASPFIYLERRKHEAIGKYCPNCNSPLEATTHYRCPNCGELSFKKL